MRSKPSERIDAAETETFRMVVELEPERRKRIAARLLRADAGTADTTLARRIAAHLLESAHVEDVWKGADPIERTLLRAASAARGVLGRGTLVRCALDRHHSAAEIDLRLERLEGEGLLFWRDVGFSPGFAVPAEISAVLRASAAADLAGPSSVARLAGPPVDHEGAFLDDVVTTLAFLRRGAYRTTRGGAVHAADLRRLGERLVYPEEVPMGATPSSALAAPPIEPFPTRLGLILDLMRRLLLVRFDPDDVKVDDRRARQWLERPADEIRRDLIKAARREPWRHQREVGAVADFLSEQTAGQWIYMEDVARALEFHPDFLGCRPDQLRARVQSGATYLCYLGAAAVFPEEVRPDAVSLTRLGARLFSDEPVVGGAAAEADGALLHVLPTFDLLLATDAPLHVRYALEVFADPAPAAPADPSVSAGAPSRLPGVRGPSRGSANAGTGPMRRYTLEKRVVLQALKGGMRMDDVLEYLHAHATEVPDSVEVTLQEWGRAYGEYYFMNPILLVCRDAAAATAARSDPKVAERVLGSLSPEILILAEGAVEPVRAALEAGGSVPRAGVEEVPPSESRPGNAGKRIDPGTRAATVAAISRFILKRASDRAMSSDPEEFDAQHRAKAQSLVETFESLTPGDRPADAPPGDPKVERRSGKLCTVAGCGRSHAARGLCTLHYQAARRGKMSFPSV